MALAYENLDVTTRRLMLEELERDVANKTVYESRRLTPQGLAEWVGLLRDAIRNGSDATLAAVIRARGLMKDVEEARTRSGGVTVKRVPVTAPDTLAEGEFNHYYVRGLCRRVMDAGAARVIVYRAKNVEVPRSESEAKIGTAMDADGLLRDLRTHHGVDTALGVPPGPNSGLSVKL
jgi:hypothetical protein